MNTSPTVGESQVLHQFARLQAMSEWWQWLTLLIVCLVVVVYVVVIHRRDSGELSRGTAWSLLILRLVAFCAILFFFLDLEKREERKFVRNSRVAILVDTSLSMAIPDSGGSTDGVRRIDEVVRELSNGKMLASLQAEHDITVYRFDQQPIPIEIAAFPKLATPGEKVAAGRIPTAELLDEAKWLAVPGVVCMLVGLLAFLTYLVWERQRRASEAWSVFVGTLALLIGIVLLGSGQARYPSASLAAILGMEPITESSATANNQTGPTSIANTPEVNVDWSAALTPQGTETRLGDALRFVVQKERGGPIAGIVLFSDGRLTTGGDLREAQLAARVAGIPVFSVGLGSEKMPTNARTVDIEAPTRVYPGDGFQVTAHVQAFGLAGRQARIELSSGVISADGQVASRIIDEVQAVPLPADGQIAQVVFELQSAEPGRRSYQCRIVPLNGEHDESDNDRAIAVDVVERKNKVLLLAGGPTREFQFLRNMLYRDRSTTVDVLLQVGAPGISQEANELLFEFPRLPDQLFAYDCIVAFDPDWSELDELQARLLEQWVAEKAGGMIVVAGTVHTPHLVARRSSSPTLNTIADLYPVVFHSRSTSAMVLSRIAADSAWPLAFTRDGQESEFLWLESDATASADAWASTPGVYGYFAVKGAKPGAKVLARFSDPNTVSDGELPVYIASQFYGAGRVLYQGSGEMWRVRAVNEGYFERYYTKLLRWVSQGRLQRDSTRGLLLVDKDRCMIGDTVSVQAVLADSQHQPLTLAEYPAVLIHPDRSRSNLPLRAISNATRPGSYSAQFSAAAEGTYRVELRLTGGTEELLAREVLTRIPRTETESPERNDPDLLALAQGTDGEYYVGLASTYDPALGRTPLVSRIEPADQTTYLPGTPDLEFDRVLMQWLMIVICGALCTEWLLRRLHRLA